MPAPQLSALTEARAALLLAPLSARVPLASLAPTALPQPTLAVPTHVRTEALAAATAPATLAPVLPTSLAQLARLKCLVPHLPARMVPLASTLEQPPSNVSAQLGTLEQLVAARSITVPAALARMELHALAVAPHTHAPVLLVTPESTAIQ